MNKSRFCGSCGKPLEPGIRFCGECGQVCEDAPDVAVPSPAPQPPAVPKASNPGGSNLKTILGAVGTLVVCGLIFALSLAGKQLCSRFTAKKTVAAQPLQTAGPVATPSSPPVAAAADSTNRAQKWVESGYALEKAGNIKDALADYAKALSITYDSSLAARIQQLQQSQQPPANSAALPTGRVTVPPGVMQAAKLIHTTMNKDAVENGARRSNTLVISEPMLVTFIANYHWNGGRGMTPGVIALEHEDGTTYGPWQATGASGQGGAPNVAWLVQPCMVLKPGKYTIKDTHPQSWSQNAASGGRGMGDIKGVPWRQVSSEP